MLLTEPAVLVPARYAGTLARLLDSWGRNAGGLPGGLGDLQREFAQASAAWQRIQLDPPATTANGSAEVPLTGVPATLSAMQVADLLRCGPRNVRDLVRRGTLTGQRVGGRWLFTPDDVAALVAERTTA